MHINSEIRYRNKKSTGRSSDDFEQLITLLSHHKYSRYLRVIADHQGIATDNLSTL
jgi:hypothetical protein